MGLGSQSVDQSIGKEKRGDETKRETKRLREREPGVGAEEKSKLTYLDARLCPGVMNFATLSCRRSLSSVCGGWFNLCTLIAQFATGVQSHPAQSDPGQVRLLKPAIIHPNAHNHEYQLTAQHTHTHTYNIYSTYNMH